MLILDGRKVILAALLATAMTVSASANDSVNTTQQTEVGQVATEVAAALPVKPAVVEDSYVTETNGRVAKPYSRARALYLRPRVSVAPKRVVSARYYRPSLMLGIGY